MILEGILVLAILGFIFFIFLNFKDKFTLNSLRKKYDDGKDKSKQGEQRRRTEERSSGVKRSELSITGSDEPKRQELLPPTEVVDDGKTSSSVGETVPSPGKTNGLTNFFTKLRKKE